MTKNKGAAAIQQAVQGAELVAFPGGGGEDINRILGDKECNDIGNAERFLGRHGQDLLHVEEVGWHVWDGKHWTRKQALKTVRQKAHATVRSIMEEVEALQKSGPPGENWSQADWEKKISNLFAWSNLSGNSPKIKAMIEEAAAYLSVEPDILDSDPCVLNVRNGTLKLSGSCDTLLPHRREDRLAKIMAVDFDPNAQCPVFDDFLKKVQPNGEIRRFLQVWTGYCLTGVTQEQKLVFNYGEGGNGKSVFIDLIAKMMGPYAASLPFSSLLKDDRKRGADATPDLARLPGARLVRASEPEKGSKFAEAQVKAITGGEEITVRHLNRGFFDFDPQFKLTLSGNHKPAIRGQDRGIWRRFLLVPWLENIPEDQQDKTLPSKLWMERSGVLNWALDGLRIWLENGLIIPNAVRVATDDYRADQDPIGRFIAECIEPAEGMNVQAAVMYDAYVQWCKANAERHWSMTAFGKALPERGISKTDGRIRVYEHVRLVNVPTATNDPPPPTDEGDYGQP